MKTYTKGEWTIETPCGFPYSGIYVVPVVRKDFPFHIAQVRQLREREESEANARLIAAAPDLLNACVGLLGAMPPALQKKWPNNVRRAQEAIAKVEKF